MALKKNVVGLAKTVGSCLLFTAVTASAGASAAARSSAQKDHGAEGIPQKLQRRTTVGMYFVY